MIKKQEDLRVVEIENLRGGKGVLKLVHILEQADAYDKGRLFGRMIVPVGASVGYHQHEGNFELYYILKGEARVNDNGQESTMGAGDMMLCKDGDYHSIENIGDTDLEFIAMVLFNN